MSRLVFAVLLLFACVAPAAEEVFLPQNRHAFYSHERIEFAVSGLKKGLRFTIAFAPRSKGHRPISFDLTSDGTTFIGVLPPGLFAPGDVDIRFEGKVRHTLHIASGVRPSPMLLSATVGNPREAGANFLVSNAFGYGLYDGKGQPLRDIRGKRSQGMEVFEKAIADNLPSLVYMYWTGYVTHKPFGSEKSWAADDLNEACRLLSLHAGQRMRRYRDNLLLVGTLDEPGLSWGKTPAGGMASGFPNWDEEAWYAARGWKYTQDPASRDDADWMRYMRARCAIMREVNERAKLDLHGFLPNTKFSTDLYAPQAIMDGTDPWNQTVNDVPSSHVFLDWGVGRLGALSGLYLEKSDDPRRKIAHAMNGQLFGTAVPQPNQSDAYRLMLNAMIASGLHSNWWLNPTGMSNADLAKVNEPAQRLGGLFAAFAPTSHDVAVLWSFTEAAMRQKDVAAREAKKKAGEQIKLLIASLPDIPGAKDKLVDISAYNVGGNYKEQVVTAHQAIARAGWAAHILHENALPKRLSAYKTLVVVGQTHELPPEAMKAVAEWVAKGGRIVTDATTRVKLPEAIVCKADLRDPAFRWGATFGPAEKKDHPFGDNREASRFHTNYFMDALARGAVAPFREALGKTKSRPVIDTTSVHLAAERHTAGKSSLVMVINAHDRLPDVKPTERYHLYNYAPLTETFTLKDVPPGAGVWCIEGADWSTARRVEKPDEPQKATFAPGEMKLYLINPQAAILRHLTALRKGHAIEILAETNGPEGVYPLTVTVTGPDRKLYHKLSRATDATGKFRDLVPMGLTTPTGAYTVVVESPVLKDKLTTRVAFDPFLPATVDSVEDAVRVLEPEAAEAFLADRSPVVIAYGKNHKRQAETLEKTLVGRGIKATAAEEGTAVRKVMYPRVWNPFADVWSVGEGKKGDVGKVERRLTLTTTREGGLSLTTADGKDAGSDWKQPSSLVTFAGAGYVDADGDREACYSPGVVAFVGKDRRVEVRNGVKSEAKTDAAFRAKWAKPWSSLRTHVGAYQLPPQLPEAWSAGTRLVVMGDSTSSDVVAALQASEILAQQVDANYPGAGRALVQVARSPFAVGKDVLFLGAGDEEGLKAAVAWAGAKR